MQHSGMVNSLSVLQACFVLFTTLSIKFVLNMRLTSIFSFLALVGFGIGCVNIGTSCRTGFHYCCCGMNRQIVGLLRMVFPCYAEIFVSASAVRTNGRLLHNVRLARCVMVRNVLIWLSVGAYSGRRVDQAGVENPKQW